MTSSNRIFQLELIVEELQMLPENRNGNGKGTNGNGTNSNGSIRLEPGTPRASAEAGDETVEVYKCPERCVRLQLAKLARCEVCERDFGSQVDVETTKQGENCMFTLNGTNLREQQLSFDISAVETEPDGNRKVLGTWREPANEILFNLLKNYDDVNFRRDKETESAESIFSEDSISRKCYPVSETIRSMYPLQLEDESVVGYVILTLRIACLGSRITQKVMFGGKDQEAITCFKGTDPEHGEQLMKCVTYDETAHPHPIICGQCEARGSMASLVTAPGSMTEVCPPYDEYTAQMNGNAITIRVEKFSDIKVMLDGEETEGACTKGCWTSLKMPEGTYALEEKYVQREKNACCLPVVRGNLKYPAQQWSGDFMMCRSKRPICAEHYRSRPDPMRNICMQTRDPEATDPANACGIEICRKGSCDPNVDVFVLKLGKNKTSRDEQAPNQIELELRTPKGPMIEKRPKETRGCQVIEEEFEDFKPPAPEKKGKKGGKKGGKKK
ncbi:uncharacterized protein LOC129745761 [Uranotaenia lowii]|uniref:uncharacterized protein LOC129745761 n=1 Tax=Uranotaenia lowii TaxID=190385 RepID=UPI002479F564|nr:uncharacterized protein LOC129745761 [Uranotaenia lowii]